MSPFAPGLRIHDRFTVERRIGTGGMSEVWRAYDAVLGRPVAVKVLTSAYTGNPAATLHEARSAARIADPNIAAIHDYGELPIDGRHVPYLVMELVEGEDLATRLHAGPLPWPRAASITAQIASGLAAAHRLGVVHRDVKPGNVMLTPTGVKLLDFGIAAPASGPDRGVLIGTPTYAAPERLRPGTPTTASDVYAVGVLLFEMLTGAPPRRYADWAQAQAGWRNPTAVPPIPGIPPQLSALLTACLSPDPAARPSAADVARIAAGVAGQPAAPAYAAGSARLPAPPTITAPPTMIQEAPYAQPRQRSLWTVAWLSAAVVLVVGVGLVLVALRDPGGTPAATNQPSTAASSAAPSPSPADAAPTSPADLVSQFDQVLEQARSEGRISNDAADAIGERMDNVRENLDESGPRLSKRVRDVNRKIEDLVNDGDLDPTLAQQLQQILLELAGN